MNGFVAGKKGCAALTALSLLTASPMAWAQEDPKAKALAYYEQAVAAYQKGDYASAASLLERAFASDPDRDLIYKYNRILALEKLGELQKALDELDPYLEPMLNDPQGRFNDAGELQQRIKAKLGEKKDPVKQDPVVVEPIEQPGPPVLGYTLIGVGGAVFITGLLFSTELFLDKELKETNYSEYEDQRSGQQIISLVGLVGGALIAGGGVALVLMHDDGSAAKEQGASGALLTPSRVTLSPSVGVDGVGAMFQLEF